jgi:hypothetical protein
MHGMFTISCLFEYWLRRIASCFFVRRRGLAWQILIKYIEFVINEHVGKLLVNGICLLSQCEELLITVLRLSFCASNFCSGD